MPVACVTLSRKEFSRDRQCAALIRFQCYLLSKHYISGHEIASRHKTPTHNGLTGVVEFVDVGAQVVVNAVALSAFGAGDVKAFERIELRPLLVRQPFPEESDTSRSPNVIPHSPPAPHELDEANELNHWACNRDRRRL